MRYGWLTRCAVAAAVLTAGTGAAAVKLEEAFGFGDHWFGPEISLDDLKGRVVLIEDWGYN